MKSIQQVVELVDVIVDSLNDSLAHAVGQAMDLDFDTKKGAHAEIFPKVEALVLKCRQLAEKAYDLEVWLEPMGADEALQGLLDPDTDDPMAWDTCYCGCMRIAHNKGVQCSCGKCSKFVSPGWEERRTGSRREALGMGTAHPKNPLGQ